ncbi:hypothetical protein HPP92_022488 [Vanilla planifolia]|uniref:FAD-binding FR-type domain-containing protein n=1 Tax=Vanilla planifolia TaxID=51239 RepID=A0A835UFC9_VANPL|nr:hypothetical protein HPP92_022488 [Vanilla planifolia]
MGCWKKEPVLVAIRALMGLVFVGWLMVWVVMPTKIFRDNWSTKLESGTRTTYLGREGTWILVFTVPILFIAVLGCVCLHLAEKNRTAERRGKQSWTLRAWRRPALLRGPLGVLSGMELAFSLMFIVLVLWALSLYLRVGLSGVSSTTAAEYREKLWEAKLYDAGLQLGLVGNLCTAFLFFPVSRGSSLLPLVGLTSESSIKYHVWIGHLVMSLFSAHGLCFIIVWLVEGRASEMLKWASVSISNVAGEIALLCGLALWAVTFPRIRRKFFELFFYTHYLYIPFLFFYLLHIGFTVFSLILPGIYLFTIDRFLRLLQSQRRVRLESARLLPDALELNFAKSPGFSYSPASALFIKVRGISSLQWHPFTISSSASLEPDRLSVVIKKDGAWTEKLYNKLSHASLERLEVAVEGPYGHSSIDFLSYDSLILVSGGSGITPFISIIRELIHRSMIPGSQTPSVSLICSFKTTDALGILHLLLPMPNSSYKVSDFSRLDIRVSAFVTREKSPPRPAEADRKLTRTVWLKPNPSDSAVAPVLGPNSWLWLAAVISSSFVSFLLLLGIVTRYYVYPIDQDTDTIFPCTKRALLNLLLMCWSIAATAGVAVLWNKKAAEREKKQMQCEVSPSLWTAAGEVECFPSGSLTEATTVHYGARPELKDMILEIGRRGGNVQVMASGPSLLRREVAAICSSSSVENLHYEAMSFTW